MVCCPAQNPVPQLSGGGARTSLLPASIPSHPARGFWERGAFLALHCRDGGCPAPEAPEAWCSGHGLIRHAASPAAWCEMGGKAAAFCAKIAANRLPFLGRSERVASANGG